MPIAQLTIGGLALVIPAAFAAGVWWCRRRAATAEKDADPSHIRLFEHSPDMVVCFDPAVGRLISANPALYRVTGYSPDELGLTGLRRLYVSDEDADAVRQGYYGTVEENKPRKLETAILNKEGRLLIISVTMFPLELQGKRYIYAIGRDVTEWKRTEQELRRAKEQADRANHIKGEFLAVLSHEIRTPLNGILGINQIMMETELTDKQREMLQVQEKSGQALLRVINDVLDYSRIEAGTVCLAEEMFHLKGCLEEVLLSFSMAAAKKGLELSFRCDGELPEMVNGDAVRLRQILVNLIGNAVKFTESGSVSLEVRVPEPYGRSGAEAAVVEFLVSDTGIGIDPSKVHLLFLPFSQLPDTTRGRNYEGTGLGLAICRDLVEMMGGEIWVDAGRKLGAAFGFRVPLKLAVQEEVVS